MIIGFSCRFDIFNFIFPKSEFHSSFGKGIVLNCVRKKLKGKKSLKVGKVHERWKRKEVALVHRSTITFSANKENYTTTVLAKVFSVIPNLVQSTRSSYILLKTFIPFILFLSR